MLERGFVVNSSARTLRVGKSNTIGVIALDLSNPFWGEVTRGIDATAGARNYTVLVGASEEKLERELQLFRLFEEHRVDGILVSSVDVDSPAIHALHKRGTRIVFLDQIDPRGMCSAATFDHVAGARLVAEHLVDNGHRRIAFINGPLSVPWCRARAHGLREGIRSKGLDPDDVIVEIMIDSMTAQDAEPAVARMIGRSTDVTAVFCVNDMVALGVLKELSRRGVSVPKDLSLVGFDDSYFSSLLSPALTTVRQYPYELGKKAAEMVIDAMDDSEPTTVVFEPELMVRESVRRIAS